jgi:hypothetical protein
MGGSRAVMGSSIVKTAFRKNIKFMLWLYNIACQLLVNTKAIFQKTHGTNTAPTPAAADVPAFTVMTEAALATAAADTVVESLAEEVAEALIEQFFVEQPLTDAERRELRTRELAEEAAIRAAAAEAAATKKAAEDTAAYRQELHRIEFVQMGIGAFHAPVHKDACLLEDGTAEDPVVLLCPHLLLRVADSGRRGGRLQMSPSLMSTLWRCTHTSAGAKKLLMNAFCIADWELPIASACRAASQNSSPQR